MPMVPGNGITTTAACCVKESYLNGKSEGISTEYDETGKIIIQGEYVDGLEEGQWKYLLGDHREEGNYRGGMRNWRMEIFF